ncbi:MAG: tyrosine--tRNA ligase [Pirellulales bacterium]|nr:tyrosine--tRNA ligase [Pirellulales bacterium]
MPSDIFSDLQARGLVNQTTDEAHLREWLLSAPRTLYIGFDPTADSLHVGSFLPLMMLRRFQRAGHRPLALVGGATGMIGDPSGKSEERKLLDLETLQHNVDCIGRQMARLLDFEPAGGKDGGGARLVNNLDWMSRFGYLDFLREIGKHFPVNVMLTKDSVKARLERTDSGLSYTEFSYMLLQAYDFVHLYDQYGCELQVGGSDQWGNITAGIDLGRRMRGASLYGMTTPLLLKSDGTKMGKSESGAVWLSAERTSPYQFYQYWVNVDDAEAGQCLRYLTELPLDEITALDAARATDPARRDSQKRLAEALTLLVHGPEGLTAATRATEILFGAEIRDLDDAQLGQIFADVPSATIPRDRLEQGIPLTDAMVETGLSPSKGEARRTIEQGGAYINNRVQKDPKALLTTADLASATTLVLRSGKKKYALLRIV